MHKQKNTKKGGAKLKSQDKKCEPQLDDTYNPPDEPCSNGHEEVSMELKKKKKSKHSTEDTEHDQEITSNGVSTKHEATIPGSEVGMPKKKKKKKKNHSDVEGVANEVTTNDLGNEEIANKEKKKKKIKRDSELNYEATEVPEDTELKNKGQPEEEEPNNNDEEEIRNKEKKKKKRKRDSELNGEATEVPEVADLQNKGQPKEEPNNDEEEILNKEKKKKKRKRDSELNGEATEVPEVSDLQNKGQPKDEPNNDEEVLKKEKKRKRKLSPNEIDCSEKFVDPSESNAKIESNDESSDFKKKKVSWKEDISESKGPEAFKDSGETTVEHPPANSSFLALLSNVDAIPDQEHLVNKRHYSLWEDSAKKKLRRAERRVELRNAKREKRNKKQRDANLEENKSKALKSISDFNIKNRKLKEKIEELVGSSETMDVKRLRLDEETASGPTRKRLKSITPDREIIPGHKWKDLTEKQKDTFNRKREQRRLEKLSVPKVVLINQANFSSLRLEDEDRSPLTLTDIQHFLIYSVHAHHSTGNIPSWVSLKYASKISKIVCVVVDGASLTDYTQYEDQLPALKSFQFQLEVITPCAYGGNFMNEFWNVPLTKNQRARLIKKHGSLREANLKGEAFESLLKMYPTGAFRPQRTTNEESRKPKRSPDATGIENSSKDDQQNSPKKPVKPFAGIRDRFPRTELLLRSWDLLRESVPVPFATGFLAKKYEGFVRTKDQYLEVTDESPIWAVDCEMCETCEGSELTRISIINEEFEVVYESLVKPYNPITNYLTQYSGITPADLQNEWTRLEDVQNDVRSLLPADVILAGHSVGNDLQAMKMFHPYVIDTSVCFNLSGIIGRKTKLKTLMAELLYERIQEGGKDGHDSVEDAASCLKLIKAKLARSIDWGDAVIGGKRSEQESVIAQQQLILRGREEKIRTIYPVAAKSIIRSGPRAHQTVEQPISGERQNPVHLKILSSLKPPAERAFVEVRDRTFYTRSLVTHLFAAGEKNLHVVGDKEFIKTGREQVDKKAQKFLRDDPRLRFSTLEDDKVLTYGCENAPSNGVSLLRLSTSKLKEEIPLKTVDKMVGQAVKSFKENVLFMVLLTGKHSGDQSSPLDNHGLIMMKILKPAYVPLKLEDLSENIS